MRFFLSVILAMLLQAPFQFDKTVHDFGEVSVKDGALHCTFVLTNTGDKPLEIHAVVTTCDCASAKWTKESIAPGESGKIEITYENNEGPYPFDKLFRVYTSAQQKPVALHVKGVVKKK